MISSALKTRSTYWLSAVFICLLAIVLQQFSIALALSQEQKNAIDSGARYFNVSEGCTVSAPASSSANNSIYLLGDSILEGSYYTTGDLKNDLNANNWSATADASAGRSITSPGSDPTNQRQGHEQSGLQAIDTDSSIIRTASVVVIELGTNTSGSAGQFENQMKQVLQKIKTLNNSAKIYWVNIISTSNPIYPSYNAAINRVGSAQGVTIIDAKSKHIALGSDNTHPTVAGYKDYSKALSDAAGSPNGVSVAASSNTCCDNSGSLVSIEGNGHVQQAFNFFATDSGLQLEPVQAAVIVGVIMEESGHKLNTTATNPDTGAYGIAQWTDPPYSSRLPALRDFAKAQKVDISDFTLQLNFMKKELLGGYKSTLSKLKAEVNGPDDINQGVYDYEATYEVSGHQLIPQRQADAHSVFRQFGNSVPSGPSGSSDTTASADCSSGNDSTSSISAYKNPFRDVSNLGGARIDEGVDYSGSGKVYAIGNGEIRNVENCGWGSCGGLGGPGAFIVYKLTDGPAKGKFVYVAENCPWKVHVGDTVTSDTVICTMVNAPPHIETGWADGSRLGNALAHDVYNEGDVTAYGVNFTQFMKCLGDTTSHERQTSYVVGKLPSDWPKWQC